VNREITNTRTHVGVLDASTLGKILVKGPDAGRFLDMLYTGSMSSLPIGKCRYGLMCNENGFLSDDGVVARLDEDSFLCHTTTGGSDRIHAWMEEWLQTEWWDWKVWTVNLTEQFCQITVVGPSADRVLERMGLAEVTSRHLPFMSHRECRSEGVSVRVFRISFSGELSFEIQVPAAHGLFLWEQVVDVGNEFGIQPYGTEALHVMRAEKGFIMIGDETDGTVIPQDLGLDWAISTSKEDYLGKRAQERMALVDANRWKLVGLKPLDPKIVLPDGAHAVAGAGVSNEPMKAIGRVTSSYWSPTLNHSIALGLVERGPERMGEIMTFSLAEGGSVQARIVKPMFLGTRPGA